MGIGSHDSFSGAGQGVHGTAAQTAADVSVPVPTFAPAIETLNLKKAYRTTIAVAGLTLAVGRGEVFGFLGPNGAGKSTVVKMLMGLIRPTSGSARILGEPIGETSVKARVGFLPEHFRFHEWLQAREFLEFHGQLYGLGSARLRSRCTEVLETVGLTDRANDRLHTFSKGMLQRIGIAQALLNDPDIVFLDEPTSALDPIGRREVRDLIRNLRLQGKTVFLNSHLLSEVEMVCDRVAILDHGRVVGQGLLQELLANRHEVALEIGNVSLALREELTQRYHLLDVSDMAMTVAVAEREEIPALAELVIHGGGKLYGLSARRLSLEDLFVSLVDRGSDK